MSHRPADLSHSNRPRNEGPISTCGIGANHLVFAALEGWNSTLRAKALFFFLDFLVAQPPLKSLSCSSSRGDVVKLGLRRASLDLQPKHSILIAGLFRLFPERM